MRGWKSHLRIQIISIEVTPTVFGNEETILPAKEDDGGRNYYGFEG